MKAPYLNYGWSDLHPQWRCEFLRDYEDGETESETELFG